MMFDENHPRQKQERYQIERYFNRNKTKTFLKSEDKTILYLSQLKLIIKLQKSQDTEDMISIYDMLSCSKTARTSKEPFLLKILLKNKENQKKQPITFKCMDIESAEKVCQKIKEYISSCEKHLNFTDLLQEEDQLIWSLLEESPTHKQIYMKLVNKIQKKKLKNILFEDHQRLIQFRRYANLKCNEKIKKQKLFQNNHYHEEPEKMIEERENEFNPKISQEIKLYEKNARQNYDQIKRLEDGQYRQSDKNPKYDEQLDVFAQIVHEDNSKISQEFENFNIEEPMEEELLEKELKGHQQLCFKIQIGKKEKGSFKINLQRQIIYGVNKQQLMSQQKAVQEISKKELLYAILLGKIFYKLIRYPQTSLEEVNCLEKELTVMLNNENLMPAYVETFVKKTLNNILKWKRKDFAF